MAWYTGCVKKPSTDSGGGYQRPQKDNVSPYVLVDGYPHKNKQKTTYQHHVGKCLVSRLAAIPWSNDSKLRISNANKSS